MLDRLVLALVIIGGINWGFIGAFRYDLVGALFGGQASTISRIIFSVVGLAALWSISFFFRNTSVMRDE